MVDEVSAVLVAVIVRFWTVEDAGPYKLCCTNTPPRREVFDLFVSLLQREEGDHDSGG